MKQLSPRWYEWSRYAPSRRLDEHGHFLAGVDGQPGVAFDPVPLQEGDLAHIAELGGASAIILTSPARGDEAHRCAATLGCPVIAAYEAAAPLPLSLLAFPVPTTPRDVSASESPSSAPVPREVAIYHKDTATALLGASVVGHPAGSLALSADGAGGAGPAPPAASPPIVAAGSPTATRDAESIPARTVRALRAPLTAGRVQLLLVGAGASLVHEPARALQDLVYRHDPTAMLLRPEELCWTPPTGMRTHGARFASRYAECARPLGLRAHDFELTEIPPGRQGGRLHRHDGEEELFVILSGRGELITQHATVPIRAGDLLGFPPRYQIPHAFRNTGDSVLRYLAFGAHSEPIDTLDYLETDVRVELTRYGKRYAFRMPEERHIPYWHGVPTD